MKERGHSQRAEIAARAAFLIAEEHIDNFALAKRKAARQLGYPENGGLPSNDEVEAALVEHRAIYGPNTTTCCVICGRKPLIYCVSLPTSAPIWPARSFPASPARIRTST